MNIRSSMISLALTLGLAACALPGSGLNQDQRQTQGQGQDWLVRSPDELLNSRWRLEDLGGRGTLDRVPLTLQFGPAGRLSGHAGCNGYMGGVQRAGGGVRIGPLASTRKACDEAVMIQETSFLQALEAGVRLRQRGDELLIDRPTPEAPLRLRREP